MKPLFWRIGAVAASAALACCLLGCSSQPTEQQGEAADKEEVALYGVGDTVETDIARFTLDRAELAIALENSGAASVGYGADGLADDNYFMPKEYNAEEDADNPYVAAKGNTLVSLTFTAENLDRDFLYLDDSDPEDFFAVEYNGTVYTGDRDLDKNGALIVRYGVENVNGEGWKDYSHMGMPVTSILMEVGQTSSFKCYIDIPVEIEDLSSPFKITVNLPNSDDETTPFTFAVNE